MVQTITAETVESGPGVGYRLAWKLRGGTPVKNRYERTRDLRVPLRDGTVVMADLYRPGGSRRRPTLLVRTPYGRSKGGLEFAYYAARGYTVLVTASRGTDGSEGVFEPMIHEADDGHDVVEWMREQPWFDGRFVTYGTSYLAFTQFALAENDYPEWKGMIAAIGPHDFGEIMHGRGAFDLLNFHGWSDLMSHRNNSSSSIFAETLAMFRSLARGKEMLATTPLEKSSTAQMRALAPWFADWVTHRDLSDPYWASYSHTSVLERIERPVLLNGAWNDLFAKQTLTQWRVLQARGVDLEVHMTRGGHAEPAAALLNLDFANRSLDWLDALLDGTPDRVVSIGHRVAIGGTKRQTVLESWPPAAAPRELCGAHGGRLRHEPAEPDGQWTTLVYDTADPTPSYGGNIMGMGAGYVNNGKLEARGDVVVYTSAPLAEDVLVAGVPRVALTVEASSGFDVFVRLCDVHKKSINVCDEITRFPEGGEHSIDLELDGTVHLFKRGHRIRLLIAAGAFPRFDLNPALLPIDRAPGSTKARLTLAISDSSVKLTLPERNSG
ncbi:CocE/NonD family hydrolase [Nocardia sp. NPDC058518]|uniref:CocE/NonD family hydrolase n=1 Tax=Nocardia sp. NPDC058518 TaxID=3346534 RepID=UPI003651D51D